MAPEYYTMTDSQRFYYRHKAVGLCVHCGKSPPWRGTTLCGPCLRKHKQSEARCDPDGERRRARRRALWHKRREAGLCVECGKPAIRGQARCEYHQMIRREKAHVKLVRERIGGKNNGTPNRC